MQDGGVVVADDVDADDGVVVSVARAIVEETPGRGAE